MAWYRAYFLNQNRHISDVEEFKSASDDQAMAQARDLLAQRQEHFAFELWQEARPVYLYPQKLAV
jgi:hypothetical protein